MGYVYKIQGDFDSIDFEDVIEKLIKKFFFMYVDDTLFVAVKDFNDDKKSKKIISKIINCSKESNRDDENDFAIVEVNKKNIERLNDVSKEWCLNNLVRLDTDRYEFEHQNDLRKYWEAIDKMEEELSRQLKEKIETNDDRLNIEQN